VIIPGGVCIIRPKHGESPVGRGRRLLMPEVEIVEGYVPGAIGRVAELHGIYYGREWGFGQYFEAKVATELSEFLARRDPRRDGFWTALVDGRIEGSITIDGSAASQEGAHLRWYILSDAKRGQGIGRRLIGTAIGFCRDIGHPQVHLWTFEGLRAARHLYEEAGFRLAEQRRGGRWGTQVTEQRFELRLG
jgi:GNAT superfamily N-acetyltransferase